MEYRMLTISREYGSGGGRIAATIAKLLGWKLLDREMIEAIANAANVESNVVRQYDERVGGWLSRINQQALRAAAMADGVGLRESEIFDAEEMVRITQKYVEQVYAEGHCVIVGRGAQCILQDKPDVFHVFVYAPLRMRVARLKSRLAADVNIEQRIREIDGQRAKYLQEYYGKSWCNPHLYDLMISSKDEEETARTIVCAMNAKRVDGGGSQ